MAWLGGAGFCLALGDAAVCASWRSVCSSWRLGKDAVCDTNIKLCLMKLSAIYVARRARGDAGWSSRDAAADVTRRVLATFFKRLCSPGWALHYTRFSPFKARIIVDIYRMLGKPPHQVLVFGLSQSLLPSFLSYMHGSPAQTSSGAQRRHLDLHISSHRWRRRILSWQHTPPLSQAPTP